MLVHAGEKGSSMLTYGLIIPCKNKQENNTSSLITYGALFHFSVFPKIDPNNALWLKPRANPIRNNRIKSSPLVVLGSPTRQSHPRAGPVSLSPGRGTRTPELTTEVGPEPEPDCVCADPNISFPISEKVEAENDETDFFRRARGEGGAHPSGRPRVKD